MHLLVNWSKEWWWINSLIISIATDSWNLYNQYMEHSIAQWQHYLRSSHTFIKPWTAGDVSGSTWLICCFWHSQPLFLTQLTEPLLWNLRHSSQLDMFIFHQQITMSHYWESKHRWGQFRSSPLWVWVAPAVTYLGPSCSLCIQSPSGMCVAMMGLPIIYVQMTNRCTCPSIQVVLVQMISVSLYWKHAERTLDNGCHPICWSSMRIKQNFSYLESDNSWPRQMQSTSALVTPWWHWLIAFET